MPNFPEPPVPFKLPYPGARMEWAIDVIGWGKNQLAEIIHTDAGSVRQMCRGHRLIPDTLGVWLETLATFHLAFPEPMGWRPKPARDADGAEVSVDSQKV